MSRCIHEHGHPKALYNSAIDRRLWNADRRRAGPERVEPDGDQPLSHDCRLARVHPVPPAPRKGNGGEPLQGKPGVAAHVLSDLPCVEDETILDTPTATCVANL